MPNDTVAVPLTRYSRYCVERQRVRGRHISAPGRWHKVTRTRQARSLVVRGLIPVVVRFGIGHSAIGIVKPGRHIVSVYCIADGMWK